MLSWLSQNLATILITLLLVAIVAAIIIGMVRKSKKIKSSCSGGCATCPYSSCGCNNHKRSDIEKAGDDKLRLPLLYSEV